MFYSNILKFLSLDIDSKNLISRLFIYKREIFLEAYVWITYYATFFLSML